MRLSTAFSYPLFSFLVLVAMPLATMGEEAAKSPWAHESEVGVVSVSGNTSSESYNGKQKTVYTGEKHSATLAGRYLETKAAGALTAKAWDASLRYERIFSDQWSAFLQHGAESNTFAGYIQRENTDLGGKYVAIKSDSENLFSELGYRYTKTRPSDGTMNRYEGFGRVYVEYTRNLNETVSAKFWVEYLPNFNDADGYMVNYEPSMTAILSSIFSLKLSYLTKFNNKPVTATDVKTDNTFSTTLVAKF